MSKKRDNPETGEKSTGSNPPSPKRQRQTILSNTLVPTLPTLPDNATISPDVEDRQSRFRGYFIPFSLASQLNKNKLIIESLAELSEADHKIMAWRVGRTTTGFEDDGEKWAGKKLLELLIASEDEGLLCVARWYGGILLGPTRFDHIVHVAADALATYHIRQKKGPLMKEPTMKAPRVLEMPVDDEERMRTLKTLRGKDMTIETLRGMILAKKVERGESPVSSPVKEKNYERMSSEGLKRLLIARDAAIKSLRDILQELQSQSSVAGVQASVLDEKASVDGASEDKGNMDDTSNRTKDAS